MLRTFDHVIVRVRDLESATPRYEALLGRAPSWRGEHPGQGTANSLFRIGNGYLELLAPVRASGFGALLLESLERQGEGPLGIAFGTDDAKVTATEFRARGLAVADPLDGEGQEQRSGVVRRWRSVLLPSEATRGVLLFAIEHLSPDEALPAAELRASEPAAVSGFDHVVVTSSDLAASRRLYGESLGLRLGAQWTDPGLGLQLLFFRIGGVTVELAGRADAARADAASDPGQPDRFWGISYRVPDVTAARERVAAAGFEASEVRKGRRTGTQVCTVRGETCGVATLLISHAAAGVRA